MFFVIFLNITIRGNIKDFEWKSSSVVWFCPVHQYQTALEHLFRAQWFGKCHWLHDWNMNHWNEVRWIPIQLKKTYIYILGSNICTVYTQDIFNSQFWHFVKNSKCSGNPVFLFVFFPLNRPNYLNWSALPLPFVPGIHIEGTLQDLLRNSYSLYSWSFGNLVQTPCFCVFFLFFFYSTWTMCSCYNRALILFTPQLVHNTSNCILFFTALPTQDQVPQWC